MNQTEKNRTKAIIIFAGMLLLFMTLTLAYAEAQEPSFIFKQNTIADLQVSCVDVGNNPCNSATLCNITIQSPDTSVLINNLGMSYNPTYFNYTLTTNQTVTNGIYTAIVNCYGVTNATRGFYYQITPAGDKSVLGMYIMFFILAYIILFIGIFTKNIPTSILGGMATSILGLYCLNNGIDIYRNFATQAISLITLVFGGFWMILASFEYLKEW